jgi:phage baseplate assembly protein W
MTAPTALKSIAWPFRAGPQGFPATINGIDAVVWHSIQGLMTTGLGERVMRTTLGTNVHAFVFDTLDGITAARIATAVGHAIALFEPRAEVLSVEARTGAASNRAETAIVIDIAYRIANQVFAQQVPIAGAPGGTP